MAATAGELATERFVAALSLCGDVGLVGTAVVALDPVGEVSMARVLCFVELFVKLLEARADLALAAVSVRLIPRGNDRSLPTLFKDFIGPVERSAAIGVELWARTPLADLCRGLVPFCSGAAVEAAVEAATGARPRSVSEPPGAEAVRLRLSVFVGAVPALDRALAAVF